MADIDNGSLSFKSVIDNGEFDAAIEESIQRIMGMSDATASMGDIVENAMQEIKNSGLDTMSALKGMKDGVIDALSEIERANAENIKSIEALESEYKELEIAAKNAVKSGDTNEIEAINERKTAINGEITVRKQFASEVEEGKAKVDELSKAIDEYSQKIANQKSKTYENAKAHQSLRTRIRDLKEEMARLIDEGIDEQSDAYKALVNELGRLQDIQGDIAQQGKILANDEAKYQGVIQGISGLSGAFSAATGTVSMFAGENEDLQKVMTKVQSVMAITMGLQTVAQTLNKDSAFQLVTVRKAKELLTVAELKFATALGISNVAAKALMATLTLGFSVAITGAIVLIDRIISKNKEAKKAQEELTDSIVEGCYKPIGKIEELSVKYKSLGENIEAQKRFIDDNKKSFDEIGVSIRDVADAQNLLIDNKDDFIQAQIEKATALALIGSDEMQEKMKRKVALLQEKKKRAGEVEFVKSSWVQGAYRPVAERLDREISALDEELMEVYKLSEESSNKAADLFVKAGIKKAGEITAGSMKELEKNLSEAKAKLSDAIIGSDEYKQAEKEVENLEKRISELSNKKTSGVTSKSSSEDLFLKRLAEYKEEYERFANWQNSSNEDIRKAAKAEFATLMEHGKNYEEYLQRLRTKLTSGKQTEEMRVQLSKVNDEIARIQEGSLLESFAEDLNKELASATNALKQLEIISNKRKELANDGTKIDNEKQKLLDQAGKNALKQQASDTKRLLDGYASYLDRKIAMDIEYSDNLALLERARATATSEEEKKRINGAIANLQKQYEKNLKKTGDTDYDQMLELYQNFEEKKQSIIDDFDEKRKIAIEHNNMALVANLDKAQKEALSKLAIDEMQNSPDWEKLFGNLDEVTTKELEKLLSMIEGQTAYLGVEFDPKSLETIKNKIQDVKNELIQRNPFNILISSVKEYGKATDSESKKNILPNMLNATVESLDLVRGGLNATIGGIQQMGLEMDEKTDEMVGNIGNVISSARDLAKGIATSNPLSIAQSAVSLLSSALKLFDSRDRDVRLAIKQHESNIKNLSDAYEELERKISKALGTETYKHQTAAIKNMKQQQEELQGMIDAERSRKKADEGKIAEWEKQKKAIGKGIEDTVDGMKNKLLDSDIKSITGELGNALFAMFENGEKSAKSWGEAVNDVVNNIVKNILRQKVIEDPIKAIVGKYTSKWFSKDGEFSGFDTVLSDINKLSGELNTLYPSLEAAMTGITDKLKLGKEAEDKSLTGAVKGVSEETASMIGGQMNAIRINQIENTEILRQQLVTLSVIARNTEYNRYILSIYNELRSMKSNDDSLRAKGLNQYQ